MDDSPGTAGPEPGAVADVRFFTIADDEYYLGLVAMVNSLRLHGHHDPVTVLDLGLTEAQRSELGHACELVQPEPGSSDDAWLLAPYVCRTREARVVVYIDADVILTTPIDSILVQAREGSICAFPEEDCDRWFPQWEEIFSLKAPLRRERYINTGLVAFSPGSHPSLLPRWEECCDGIRDHAGTADGRGRATPTGLPDQDALNALLMSELNADTLALQPECVVSHGTDALHRTRVVDRQRLLCRRDGEPTTFLHSWGMPKPWQAAAGRNLRRTAYLVCLRRLLDGTDVAVQSTQPRVAWLAPGVRGTLSCLWRYTYATARRLASPLVRKVLPHAYRQTMSVVNAGAQPVRSIRASLDRNLRQRVAQ